MNKFEVSKFAERLKSLRLEKGLTQVQPAKMTNLAQTTISSAYEKRRNSPSDETIIILCKFFGVSADYILRLED